MIHNFADFCLYLFVLVDDVLRQFAPLLRRPGPQPLCSDSEIIAMSLIAECRGWDVETEAVAQLKQHPDLFPFVPERSRFNRRRRNLMQFFNLVRQQVVRSLDLIDDGQMVIDSLPVPVVEFHLAPASKAAWAVHGADYGRCASKKKMIYGYKLHLLMTLSGLIVDYALAPASLTDLLVGEPLLRDLRQRTVIGDKAYISKPVQESLWQNQRVKLLTVPRSNQKVQLPKVLARGLNRLRQVVESVNAQLSEQLHIERNHATSFWGLCTRLHTKLAAHTLCIKLNRMLGKREFLQIKALAFPSG